MRKLVVNILGILFIVVIAIGIVLAISQLLSPEYGDRVFFIFPPTGIIACRTIDTSEMVGYDCVGSSGRHYSEYHYSQIDDLGKK